MMHKKGIVFCICILFNFVVQANEMDTTEPEGNTVSVAELPPKNFRNFESLEKFNTIENNKTDTTEQSEGFELNNAKDEQLLNDAQEVFDKIESTNNFIDYLSQEELSELPVGITPYKNNNVSYTVGIAKVKFKPKYAILTVFLKMTTPKGDLFFGSDDIKLSSAGGLLGDTRLNLISNFKINFNNGKAVLTLKGGLATQSTYALIDCAGFKDLFLNANIKFLGDQVFPVDQNGKKINNRYLESDFNISISDWNDLLAEVSLPPFGIKGLKNTSFHMEKAVIDLSDLRNHENQPQEYLSKYYGANPLLWRGVYIQTLNVSLPKAFANKSNNQRTTFAATDMIIDEQGITGNFISENLLSINDGSASGWQFSIDRFAFQIEANAILRGEFDGEISLPVSTVDKLQYKALIQEDVYNFRITSLEDLTFDTFRSKVTLTRDSFIEMEFISDALRPKASLNGSFDLISGLSKKEDSKTKNTVNFKGLYFEKLVLQTESPKISVGNFGIKKEKNQDLSLAFFPVNLNDVALNTPTENNLELAIDFSINLSSETDGGNGGSAKLILKAKQDNDRGIDRWKYDGIDLERIGINMQVPGLKLKGDITIFEDDATYGTGFAGGVSAQFTTGINLGVETKVLFGKTEDFRYWFADGSVTLPTGIPIFPGFAANSFGGGFYNRMRMSGVNRNPSEDTTSFIGTSTSGVVYEPYNQNGFGMKASMGIITQNSEELFHANVEFGISFLRSGGLQEIYFKGEGELITALPNDFYDKVSAKLEKIADNKESITPFQPEGSMSANVFISYDFVNDVFHGTSELYINFGILEGIGANGRAGWLDFYVSPDKWHLLVGTPSDPVGVKLDIGILKLETRSYFMTGVDIPGSPPPPSYIASALGVDASKLDYTRDLNLLESGKGLAFGTRYDVSTGDLRFLIFYARFDAGIGFDVMVKDYGDAHCKGSTEQIGLNGWYANGQAYGYLAGKVGLRIKILGRKKNVSIFSGSAAVLMQARLPNPFWMRGYFGGTYRVLGGLVKGSFRFKVELGDKCEIVGDVLDGIVVIGDMTPKTGATDVDVFAAPQVSFNLQINKQIQIPDDTGDHTYRIMLDTFEITQNGTPIKGEVEWNRSNSLATFYSHEILPPKTELKSFVQLHFEELINGKWQVIKDNGNPAVETKEITFVTGVAPKTIPKHNIAYMYPVAEQQYFFTKEYNTGYINLKRGQQYLFDAVPNFEKTVTITDASGQSKAQQFTYNTANKQLVFDLSTGLSTQTQYQVDITLIPSENSNIEDSLSESYTASDLGQGDEEHQNLVEVRNNTLSDVAIKGEERKLLDFKFKTSSFTKFSKKMKALKKTKALYDHVPYPYGIALSTKIEPSEPFDLIELVGSPLSGGKPLIQPEALLKDNYYKNKIYPLLYEDYPMHNTFQVTRDTDVVGIPPKEGVKPRSSYLTYLENEVSQHQYNTVIPFRHDLSLYYYQDYVDLRTQLLQSGMEWQNNPKHVDFVTNSFPVMRKGYYDTKLQYRLPGQQITGSSYFKKYENPINE